MKNINKIKQSSCPIITHIYISMYRTTYHNKGSTTYFLFCVSFLFCRVGYFQVDFNETIFFIYIECSAVGQPWILLFSILFNCSHEFDAPIV